MVQEQRKRTRTEQLLLVLRGMAMGAADVVPGVSGGTIAFITGIYDELLHSLKSIRPYTVVILKREGLAAAWQSINGTFLLCVFAGILISLKTFAALISLGLENYPVLVWAFFFGLVVASIYYFAKQQTGWGWRHWLACLLGAAFVYLLSIATPAQLPGTWWILFCGGFVAICAMILPGVSGSFLLLLVGLYPEFLRAINTMDLVALGSFGLGCVAGLLVFSRFLSWLLDYYHKVTLAALIGFLVGSLNVIWPWKQTLVTTIDRHGEVIPLVQQNVLPGQYSQEPLLMFALLCAALGAFLVLIAEYFSDKMANNN